MDLVISLLHWPLLSRLSMVVKDPLRPPWLVVEAPGVQLLPNGLVRTLSDRFRVTNDIRGGLGLEACSERILQAFLGQLIASVDPVSLF